jgi:hypothetical protein
MCVSTQMCYSSVWFLVFYVQKSDLRFVTEPCYSFSQCSLCWLLLRVSLLLFACRHTLYEPIFLTIVIKPTSTDKRGTQIERLSQNTRVEKLTFYFFPKNRKLSISDKRNLMHVLFAIFFILRLELFVILSFAWQFYVTRSFIGPSSSSSSLDCLLLLPCGKWHKWQRKNDFTLHYTDYRDGHDAFELDGWIDETQFRKLYWVCQASTLLSRKFRSAAK